VPFGKKKGSSEDYYLIKTKVKEHKMENTFEGDIERKHQFVRLRKEGHRKKGKGNRRIDRHS